MFDVDSRSIFPTNTSSSDDCMNMENIHNRYDDADSEHFTLYIRIHKNIIFHYFLENLPHSITCLNSMYKPDVCLKPQSHRATMLRPSQLRPKNVGIVFCAGISNRKYVIHQAHKPHNFVKICTCISLATK